ncbi:MAG: glycosyltransferase [Rhodospirillales bacterium]|nr:glycosyltransferase [Rhodospirillales bacterium]HIJ43885.1 glycosyltransferase [Rhodospirillaceae bacterium]MDP7216584.1 glycosyltransferase [Rhodospirillales bacterium]HIJ45697.1 glycosyltransferase [Rhodospirillaceae bacterium]HIJ92064.1 glycosyltransferase [Rhodospirillaceae bacterium]
MNRPRISVVIPTYNQAAYLREALASVLAQTMPDWEAVVVNNFSSDDTVEAVESLADPRVTMVNFANGGIIAASRNLGLAKARAEWTAFLDSDDKWRPEKLERCLATADDALDVVGHGLVMFKGEREIRTILSGPGNKARYRSLLFGGSCMTPSAILIRTEFLKGLGGFSEDRAYITAEDYELWLKMAGAGACFAFIPDLLTDYRIHESSASNSIQLHRDSSLRVVEDHYRAMAGKRWPDPIRWRRRIALIHYGAARKFLAAGDRRACRASTFKSLSLFPFTARAYANLLLCLLPLARS